MTAAQAQLTVPGFTTYSRQGFEVLVNDQALSQHPAATQNAVAYLDTLLLRITQLGLADDILDSLRHVPIFMEWALTTGSAWYHYDVNWLIQNGYNPAKAKAVEIANISNFVAWSKQNQPMIIMHELTHAYHDRKLGLSYAPVTAAYNAAIASGIYNSVPYNPGNGGGLFSQPAYARVNALEYFAEITEAYLGENDYFPFDSTDLKAHDPAGFAAAKTVWRFGGTTSAGPGAEAPWQLAAFPNPARSRLFVESTVPQPLEIRLLDLTGRVRLRETLGPQGLQLDLDGLPAGTYVLRASGAGHSSSQAILKY
jgi:hypothetical protein